MALPALVALARLGPLEVHGPGWLPELLRGVPVRTRAPGPLGAEVQEAVLFAPSFRAAWQSRRARRRIGIAGDHRRWLLTHVVAPGVHRADTYAALARAAGADPRGPPFLEAHPDVPVPDVPEGHVGLNPVVVRGDTRTWGGFGALAAHLDRPVVYYGGPGEQQAVAAIAGEYPQRVGLSVPSFLSALTRCAVFVSNDSGAAHVAAAAGVPTVVVFGSTAPERTGPAGAVAVRGPALACGPCYKHRCHVGRGCLAVPMASVVRAVERALEGRGG